MITQEEVRRLFHYDPETGKLTWRESRANNKIKAGYEAGCMRVSSCGKKYRQVVICYTKYSSHRIIWLYVHGHFPDEIDHINGNGLDNRLINLRDVSGHENSRNARKYVNNTSGHTGVSWCKSSVKWEAYIKVSGRKIHLGYFANKQDAIDARAKASKEYEFHENHGDDRPL